MLWVVFRAFVQRHLGILRTSFCDRDPKPLSNLLMRSVKSVVWFSRCFLVFFVSEKRHSPRWQLGHTITRTYSNTSSSVIWASENPVCFISSQKRNVRNLSLMQNFVHVSSIQNRLGGMHCFLRSEVGKECEVKALDVKYYSLFLHSYGRLSSHDRGRIWYEVSLKRSGTSICSIFTPTF